MSRSERTRWLALGIALFLPLLLIPDLWAFSVTENKMFSEGPYLFKMEVEVNGRGNPKKNPIRMTALKVKIKNDRASSKPLTVKSIRAYLDSQSYQDIETKGYPITPAQWVTKYYRLPKGKQPLLGEQPSIEIAFDTFTIRFNPRDRKFQGPTN
ncbi:MAG TPA: hypothetical protein VEH09_10730 [Thermodesulfobacteriota bacterium]|nr:hypothetical protein [Thermodesulfobacteriota bacterium]